MSLPAETTCDYNTNQFKLVDYFQIASFLKAQLGRKVLSFTVNEGQAFCLLTVELHGVIRSE